MATKGKNLRIERPAMWGSRQGASSGRLRVIYPKVFRQGVELTRKLERKSPRLMVGFFSFVFLLVCIGATWLVSGGKSVFDADIAGVSDHDH